MAESKLSAVEVARKTKAGRYADGGGLYLQVTEWKTKAGKTSVSKSWLLRYERNGRERQMGLGPIDLVGLAEARERARAARRLLLDGKDPIEARRVEKAALALAQAQGMTFAECAEAFISAQAPGWRNAKHSAQWKSTLDRYAAPVIGKLPVAAVDTALMLNILEPIWTAKTETANRVRGRIEKILDWARVRGYRTGENPARWKGHLDHLLARKSKVSPVKHRPALPYSELPAFMAELRAKESPSARALEFLTLTVARTSEVLLARWREIDRNKKVWTVPAARTKSGRDHRVPLTDRMLAILAVQSSGEDSPDAWIFPGGKAGRPLSNMALLELMRDMRPGYVTHGLRSTFRDWGAETTRHENIVLEMALAHKIDDEVEAAYRRGDLFEKRRSVMQDWTRFCSQPHSANIVRIRRR